MTTPVNPSPRAGDVDEWLIQNRPATVAQLFAERVAATPEREAFRYRVGDHWHSATWAEVDRRVRALAAGLLTLGVDPEQRVAVASATRFEWILADLAVMCAAAATTTIYPTTTASEVAYIVADSQSRVVFAEDGDQVEKLRSARNQLPLLARVVVFDGAGDGEWVITLEELARLGEGLLEDRPDVLAERQAKIGPDSLATVIYTSGTTGRPTGVRLRHSAWTYEAAAIAASRTLTENDLQLLWLPLAHVFGKVLLTAPLQIGFCTAVDGRVDRIVENLAVVRPTFMGAAPRIFEKAYARVTAAVVADGGMKQKLFDWAVAVGHRGALARRSGAPISPALALQLAVADRVVLAKVRARFGGRLRFFVSGSAALNPEIAEWFDAVGITILEGYGLTESSAASLCNRPEAYAFGTVGTPYPGTEVRLAGDGEILLRGPGIMEGYHNMPEATAEVLTADGWFHTGDIGTFDEQGFLRITDRKKDLFKTSGGKYVAPSAIESRFKGICPLASQLVVYGENRNFVTALVTLDPDAIMSWAAEHAMAGWAYQDIAVSVAARDCVQGYIDQLNARLNPWETIKKFAILGHDLSVEGGELTPSLKLKRRAVTAKFAAELDSLYR